MIDIMLQCLSHTPLVGFVDPPRPVLDEVNKMIADARARIAAFQPELVVLFSPDHFNGFFYDIMPSFCIGTSAHAIGDFGSAAGEILVPFDLALDCATSVIEDGVDVAVTHRMQVDHGFAQPLDFLLGGLDRVPTIPVFINAVGAPLPTFQRTRALGEAIGNWARGTGKRVLLIGSGGLSHQPPVPEYATASEKVREGLLGGGRNLSPEARAARTDRVINAARAFVEDQTSLHPINPAWDNGFLDILAGQKMTELDMLGNDMLSAIAGRSAHEVKTWAAAFAALSRFGPHAAEHRYYREIPEWIAGFGAISARPLGA
ncbi:MULTISPECIES: 3-carboxyethylcatechol 2,3-dioxygenase [unclassified Novosphingobium]|uniref:3-carboxyethylcatechol 2,3-dioxygenase n=1 Tax=unclassified Novosphingobium TaxID=2644732 RepID=UPI00135715E4|nr:MULTISPECIES: 3-carboxyethylcatechol 2,3-dioxygenase [unclassified Novosphingobium]